MFSINNRYFLLAFSLFVTLISCEDKNVGDFVLTGNIESLIPKNSYDLKQTTTDDGQYIVFTPNLHSNFEYWGLTLEKVEYYLDGTLYAIKQTLPCELILAKDDITIGNHTMKAQMTIVGEACDDAILEIEKEFNVSDYGHISELHGDFYINYNYVGQGDQLVVTPELLVERSSEGCTIDEVKYYWDGVLIATETSTPFTLRYQVNEEVGSIHNLEATIYYHDYKNHNLTLRWGYSGYTIYSEDDDFFTWTIKSSRNNYINGETVSLIAKLFKGKNVTTNHEIEFYLDGELIGQSSSFPYTLDYKLSDLSIGTHTITGKCISKEGDNVSSTSNDKVIIITK